MLRKDQFQSHVVATAYEYWLSKRRPGAPPRRSDIQPSELRSILPHIFLVDVVLPRPEFRFRLVGSEITAMAGKEYTGLRVNERDYGPHWERVHASYLDVVLSREPRLDTYHAPWVTKEFWVYERLIAPLSTAGGAIDMLFGCLYPVPEIAADGRLSSAAGRNLP